FDNRQRAVIASLTLLIVLTVFSDVALLIAHGGVYEGEKIWVNAAIWVSTLSLPLLLMAAWLSRSQENGMPALVAMLEQMANGNLNTRLEISSHDEAGRIARLATQIQSGLQTLLADMKRMSAEHEAGDIDVRMDETKFEGAYREMVSGI
ncbi:hypothetical protein C3E98_043610, partial [Pseudomonas sp. MWU13-2625]